MTYKNELLKNTSNVAIWGTGYIGYSTMLHLAAEGVNCVGYDPDRERVALINRGGHPVPGLNDWINIDPLPLLAENRMRATDNVQEVLGPNVLVHVVAVPTERGGQPWWEPLRQVINHLADALAAGRRRRIPPLVVIESTLTPGTTDNLILPILADHDLEIGRDLLLGIAPRRDWFVAPDKTLRTLDRIFCGIDADSTEATYDLLTILCTNLHRASNHRVGELVKCVENAYRHVEIVLANQLCLGYPDVDMREVLSLASTKWNMGLFHPSFGTGGYCIPLAGQYVMQGATYPETLSLLSAAFESDLDMRRRVAQAVLSRGRQAIGILGLAYRGDLKVSAMSPTLLIAKHLVDAGASVRIHDPYYSADEITGATGSPTFELPDDLEMFDTLLVNASHERYLEADIKRAVLARADTLLVIDNYGAWSHWEWPPQAQYYRAGSRGWLDSPNIGIESPDNTAALHANSAA